jgi:hypothetical protein
VAEKEDTLQLGMSVHYVAQRAGVAPTLRRGLFALWESASRKASLTPNTWVVAAKRLMACYQADARIL